MRLVTLMMSNLGLMGIVLRAAQKSPDLKSALFGAVSGHTPYREILTQVLRPNIIATILRSFK
jgi:hypothetical protein